MEFDENILVFKDHIQLFWACFWGLPLSVDPLATCMCFFQVCSGLFTLDMQLSITRKCFLLECWTEFYWLSIDVSDQTVLITWWDSFLMRYLVLCAFPPDGNLWVGSHVKGHMRLMYVLMSFDSIWITMTGIFFLKKK